MSYLGSHGMTKELQLQSQKCIRWPVLTTFSHAGGEADFASDCKGFWRVPSHRAVFCTYCTVKVEHEAWNTVGKNWLQPLAADVPWGYNRPGVRSHKSPEVDLAKNN